METKEQLTATQVYILTRADKIIAMREDFRRYEQTCLDANICPKCSGDLDFQLHGIPGDGGGVSYRCKCGYDSGENHCSY